jgi:hypothetical protein
MIKSKTGRLNENSPDTSGHGKRAQIKQYTTAGRTRSIQNNSPPVYYLTHHGPAIYREREHMANTDGFQQTSRKMGGWMGR